MTDMTIKTPWHLWLVGVIAVLFNAIGAFDYFLVFAVSLAAFLVSLIYTYVLTDGGEIMGGQMAITSVVITALLLFFMWYSWLMTKRSVLR